MLRTLAFVKVIKPIKTFRAFKGLGEDAMVRYHTNFTLPFLYITMFVCYNFLL